MLQIYPRSWRMEASSTRCGPTSSITPPTPWATAVPCASARLGRTISFWWRSRTAVRVFQPRLSRGSLSHFLPPKGSATGRVWVSISFTALSAECMARFPWIPCPETRALACAFPFNLTSSRRRNDGRRLYPYGSNSSPETKAAGLRRVSQDGRQLGALAPVRDLRPRRLLRFFQEQACHQTFSRHQASYCEVHRAGRRLVLVLHRRSHVRRRMKRPVGARP